MDTLLYTTLHRTEHARSVHVHEESRAIFCTSIIKIFLIRRMKGQKDCKCGFEMCRKKWYSS